jgi:hypothetical protein
VKTSRDRTPCDPWFERLSAYLDGELSGFRRRNLEQHLSGCPHCSAALADLRQVVTRAKAWNEPSEPSTDLWPGIAARLEPRRPAWWRLPMAARFRWPLPRIAAAIILVALAVVWSQSVRQPPVRQAVVRPSPGPASFASAPEDDHDRDYETTVASLRREAVARLTHDPHVVEVLDENLATLDAAIANYGEALTDDPADTVLRRRLDQARLRKIDVLRRAVALTAEGGE